jgi:hypothetical protein
MDSHLLFIGLWLYRIAGQVWVTSIAGLVLLLSPLPFIFISALHILVIHNIFFGMPMTSPVGVPII